MTVHKRSDINETQYQSRDLIRALRKGTNGMRLEGRKFLPQEQDESDADYDRRLSRSVLFNAFSRTLQTLTGKPFRNPLTYFVDNSRLDEAIKRVTPEGENLTSFGRTVFIDGLAYGLTHILIDATNDGTGRPYFISISDDQILGFKEENGILTQLRYIETTSQDKDVFLTEQVEQIRVWTPGHVDVYRKADKDWILFNSYDVTLDYIPFLTFYTGRTGFMTADSEMQDLAELNGAHWRSDSDQRNILHVARVPILFGKGFDEEEKLTVGGNTAILTNNTDATLQWIEHSGKAIDAGRDDLSRLEDAMAVMGLELINRTSGNPTATSKAIDAAGNNSALASMAIGLKATLEDAIKIMGDWIGVEVNPVVDIETDYNITLDMTDIRLLLESRVAREVSQDTYWRELKRRNVIN